MIPSEEYREVVETLIRQEGSCFEPVEVYCDECPFSLEKDICYNRNILWKSKIYLAELNKVRDNKDVK